MLPNHLWKFNSAVFCFTFLLLSISFSVSAVQPDQNLANSRASFWGEDASDSAGILVAIAGDVNGDGYDDILIGAHNDDDGGNNAGQSYLIFGKATGWAMDTDLSAADASFWGEAAGDVSGNSVSGAGDVNNDGYDDILIGAYNNDEGGADAGQTYLIFGKASGWAMDTDLSAADASFWGEDSSDRSGFAAQGAGDVNNDGYDDILINAYADEDGGSNAGQTYLILGKATGWAMDTSLSTADASFWGEDSGDFSGFKLAGKGDVNNDGYDDFLLGALFDEDGGSNAGQVYLILGKSSGWAMDTSLSTADASFWGEDSTDQAGTSVSIAGDVNNDGYADILIGAYGDEDGGGVYAGQVYLIFGKASGWAMDTSLSTADASFWGIDSGEQAGESVSSAGDVNNDGYDDILIGATSDDDGSSNMGQTYLIFGKATGWVMDTDLSTADASFWGEDSNDISGKYISSAGDVNNDGYDDILISATGDEEGGGANAGQTYLILGDNIVVSHTDDTTEVVENGATDVIEVSMTAYPAQDVVVELSAANGELEFTPSSLTFTSANWRSSQSITVSVVDDSEYMGDRTDDIEFTVTSADTSFDDFSMPAFTVNIIEDEAEPEDEVEDAEYRDFDEDRGGTSHYNLKIAFISGIAVGDSVDLIEAETKNRNDKIKLITFNSNKPHFIFKKIAEDDKDVDVSRYDVQIQKVDSISLERLDNYKTIIKGIRHDSPSKGKNSVVKNGFKIRYKGENSDTIEVYPHDNSKIIKDGIYYVRIKARDKSGNSINSDEIKLIIDTKVTPVLE